VGTVLFLGGVAQVADDLVVGGHGLLAPVHPLVQRVPLGLGLEDRGAAVIQVALVVVLAALLAHGVKDGLLLGADLLGGLLVDGLLLEEGLVPIALGALGQRQLLIEGRVGEEGLQLEVLLLADAIGLVVVAARAADGG